MYNDLVIFSQDSLFCLSADSGHFLYRALHSTGSGKFHLCGGFLHAASLSPSGACLCQGLMNTVEAKIRAGAAVTLMTKQTEGRAIQPFLIRRNDYASGRIMLLSHRVSVNVTTLSHLIFVKWFALNQ